LKKIVLEIKLSSKKKKRPVLQNNKHDRPIFYLNNKIDKGFCYEVILRRNVHMATLGVKSQV